MTSTVWKGNWTSYERALWSNYKKFLLSYFLFNGLVVQVGCVCETPWPRADHPESQAEGWRVKVTKLVNVTDTCKYLTREEYMDRIHTCICTLYKSKVTGIVEVCIQTGKQTERQTQTICRLHQHTIRVEGSGGIYKFHAEYNCQNPYIFLPVSLLPCNYALFTVVFFERRAIL